MDNATYNKEVDSAKEERLDPSMPSRTVLVAGAARIPRWGFLAAGAALGLAVAWLGITRPLAQELAQMQRQLASLERGMSALAGQTGQAARASELLAVLAEQGERAEAAASALDNLRQLEEQLIEGDLATAEAGQALDGLAELRDTAVELREDAAAIATALDSLEDLQLRIAGQYNGILSAQDTVKQMVRLKQMVQLEAGSIGLARQASEELLELKAGILCGTDPEELERAGTALDGMIVIREQLGAHAAGVPAAQDGLTGLVALKEQVIAGTSNLADAVETLEVAADLERQFVETARSFERVRRWMSDVALLEPLVEQAVTALSPLTELGNLRRLSGVELRQAARAIADERARVAGERPPGVAGTQVSNAVFD